MYHDSTSDWQMKQMVNRKSTGTCLYYLGSRRIINFMVQRNATSSYRYDQARTTVRLLQSCIRLAQGHARLMCREEVTVQVFSPELIQNRALHTVTVCTREAFINMHADFLF